MELPQWEQLIPHYSLTFPNPIRLDNLSAQTKAKFYRAYLGDVDFLLKELQYENNKNDFDAVVREKIETLRNLSHSNMTKYFGLAMRQVAVNSLILYRISTEYHTGGDLSQWVQRRLADPNQQTKATLFTPHAIIQKFLRDLLAGLCYIHSFGIIHCDIKPENILLRQRKRHSLVIVDFEGSAMNGERQGRVQSVDFTARYAAPELMLCAAMLGNDCASAVTISDKTDIWSVGCVAIQLCTGAHPIIRKWKEPIGAMEDWEGSYGEQTFTQRQQIMYQVAEHQARPKIPDLGNTTADILVINFMKSCLQFTMENRRTAVQLLSDRHGYLCYEQE
ncbi:uncharacterized protein LOC129584395 isoform X1 [Paramacrobiotus metropolitanus]|uniref:uncharacterized protein LOC129584395 isoform X1 n=1 Tax=Paramacrobiotus metropolitanus TaxID=2943436 RepID=UPI00244630E7|nr:uncharacterized protein LOC129584395 isoform X1 [Paramacrobiotus metropolitanus]